MKNLSLQTLNYVCAFAFTSAQNESHDCRRTGELGPRVGSPSVPGVEEPWVVYAAVMRSTALMSDGVAGTEDIRSGERVTGLACRDASDGLDSCWGLEVGVDEWSPVGAECPTRVVLDRVECLRMNSGVQFGSSRETLACPKSSS